MKPGIVLALACVAVALAGCGGPPWVEHRYPEWKFRVALPGEGKVEKSEGGPGSPNGVLESLVVRCDDADHDLGFTVEAHRSVKADEPLIGRLMDWIDYGDRSPGTELKKYPLRAVEYRYTRPGKSDGYVVRFITRGKLGYILSAWGKTPAALDSAEVRRFFDSFDIEE
jgi:hypothetical protein